MWNWIGHLYALTILLLAFFLKYTHENLIPFFFWVETSTKIGLWSLSQISTWLNRTQRYFSIPIKFLASLESEKLFHCNQLWKFALCNFATRCFFPHASLTKLFLSQKRNFTQQCSLIPSTLYSSSTQQSST